LSKKVKEIITGWATTNWDLCVRFSEISDGRKVLVELERTQSVSTISLSASPQTFFFSSRFSGTHSWMCLAPFTHSSKLFVPVFLANQIKCVRKNGKNMKFFFVTRTLNECTLLMGIEGASEHASAFERLQLLGDVLQSAGNLLRLNIVDENLVSHAGKQHGPAAANQPAKAIIYKLDPNV
jgi:hypothetical protein